LGLDKSALKLSAGFGGGMGAEETCGTLTGGVMVLSSLFIADRGHESDYVKGLCAEYFRDFAQKMGSLNCARLKEMHRDDERGCLPVVVVAARVLEGIIDRELAAGARRKAE